MRKNYALILLLWVSLVGALPSGAQTTNNYLVNFSAFGHSAANVSSVTIAPLSWSVNSLGFLVSDPVTLSRANYPQITNGFVIFSNQLSGYAYSITLNGYNTYSTNFFVNTNDAAPFATFDISARVGTSPRPNVFYYSSTIFTNYNVTTNTGSGGIPNVVTNDFGTNNQTLSLNTNSPTVTAIAASVVAPAQTNAQIISSLWQIKIIGSTVAGWATNYVQVGWMPTNVYPRFVLFTNVTDPNKVVWLNDAFTGPGSQFVVTYSNNYSAGLYYNNLDWTDPNFNTSGAGWQQWNGPADTITSVISLAYFTNSSFGGISGTNFYGGLPNQNLTPAPTAYALNPPSEVSRNLRGALETNGPATLLSIGDSMSSLTVSLYPPNINVGNSIKTLFNRVQTIYGNGGFIGPIWDFSYNTNNFYSHDSFIGAVTWPVVLYETCPILTNGQSARFYQGETNGFAPNVPVNQVSLCFLQQTNGGLVTVSITNSVQTNVFNLSTAGGQSQSAPGIIWTNIAVGGVNQQVYVSASSGTNVVYLGGLRNTNSGLTVASYAFGGHGYQDMQAIGISAVLQIFTNINPSLIIAFDKHFDGEYTRWNTATNFLAQINNWPLTLVTAPPLNLLNGADNTTENGMIKAAAAFLGTNCAVADLAGLFPSYYNLHPTPSEAPLWGDAIFRLHGFSQAPVAQANTANLNNSGYYFAQFTNQNNIFSGTFTANPASVNTPVVAITNNSDRFVNLMGNGLLAGSKNGLFMQAGINRGGGVDSGYINLSGTNGAAVNVSAAPGGGIVETGDASFTSQSNVVAASFIATGPVGIVDNGALTVSNNNLTALSILGSNANYMEFNIQNLNPAGTADWTATADNGNGVTNYLNGGINGSKYVPGAGVLGSTNDTYLISAGKNFFEDVVGGGNAELWTSQANTNTAVTTNMVLNSTGLTLNTGTFSGSGSGLTGLNASQLTTGTVADARLNVADGWILRNTYGLGPTVTASSSQDITNYSSFFGYGFTGSTITGLITNTTLSGYYEISGSLSIYINVSTNNFGDIYTNGVGCQRYFPLWAAQSANTGPSSFSTIINLPTTNIGVSLRVVTGAAQSGNLNSVLLKAKYLHQ